jgi:O-antigen/teichoic acid export membrane protein
MMIVIIQNTDHIMLTAMIGTVENGYYAAAITTAGIVQFVYVAIIDSFRPMILSFKKEDGVQYEKSICRLYGLITYLSIAQSIVFTAFAPLLIGLLYGDSYIAAISVLQILVWYMVFACMGSIRNIWLLAEGKQKYLPFINLSGVVFNIALNFVMIPMWGACGAALASLLTQFFINFVLGFIMKPLRVNNRLLIKGLNPRFFLHEIKATLRYLQKKE